MTRRQPCQAAQRISGNFLPRPPRRAERHAARSIPNANAADIGGLTQRPAAVPNFAGVKFQTKTVPGLEGNIFERTQSAWRRIRYKCP